MKRFLLKDILTERLALPDSTWVADFEKTLFAPLPSDFRTYLLEINGGVLPEQYMFHKTLKEGVCFPEFFYGLDPFHEMTYLDLRHQKGLMEGIADFLLPIADDGMGNYYCLSLRPQDYGQIFFYDHEDNIIAFQEEEGVKPLDFELTMTFSSFTEFVSNITLNNNLSDNEHLSAFQLLVYQQQVPELNAWIENIAKTHPQASEVLTQCLEKLMYIEVSFQNAEIVQKLLDCGAEKGESFCYFYVGSLDLFRLLLAEGVPLALRDSSGYTPFVHAAEFREPEVVSFVMEHLQPDAAQREEARTAVNEALQTFLEMSHYNAEHIARLRRVLKTLGGT